MTDSLLARVRHSVTGHEYNMARALAEVDPDVQILDKPTHTPNGAEIGPKHRLVLDAPKPLTRMTVAELDQLAAERGVDLSSAATKADRIALLEDAPAEPATSATTTTEADEEAGA